MEIKTFEKHCIITPFSPKLDSGDVSKLVKIFNSISGMEIGIDLKYVKDCTIEFFDGIKNLEDAALFNICSDIFVMLNFMNLDKMLNLYVSESDFLDSKRRMLKRNLHVLG